MITLSLAVRNARTQSLLGALDANAAPGTISFFGGSRPATGAAITVQPSAGSVATLTKPCGTVSGGDLTFAAISPGVAVGGVVITWARFRDGAGSFVADASVGMAGSGADIIFDDNEPAAGYALAPTGVQVIRGGAA